MSDKADQGRVIHHPAGADNYFILSVVSYGPFQGSILWGVLMDEQPPFFGAIYTQPDQITDHPHLKFQLTVRRKLPDFISTNIVYPWLISRPLETLLRANGIRFATYSCTLINARGEEIDPGFSIFHLLDVREGIDIAGSVILNEGRTVEKLKLAESILEAEPLLFREEQRSYASIVYVHRKLLSDFETAGITGYEAIPVSRYRWNKDHRLRFNKLPLP